MPTAKEKAFAAGLVGKKLGETSDRNVCIYIPYKN